MSLHIETEEANNNKQDLNYYTLEPLDPLSTVLHHTSIIVENDLPRDSTITNLNSPQNNLHCEKLQEIYEKQSSSREEFENRFFNQTLVYNSENNSNDANGLKGNFYEPYNDTAGNFQKSRLSYNNTVPENYIVNTSVEVVDLSCKPLENLENHEQNSTVNLHSSYTINNGIQNESVNNFKLNNSIYQLLISCHRGRVLLKAYEKLQKLYQINELTQTNKQYSYSEYAKDSDSETGDVSDDDTEFINSENKYEKLYSISKMCSLIMEHEVDLNGYETNNERLEFIANSIVLIFPTEPKTYWYSASAKGADGGTVSVRGALYNKLRKLRTELSYLEEIEKPSCSLTLTDEPDPLQKIKFINVIDINFNKLWTDLSEERKKYFAANSITAILKDFPILKSTDGLSLLISDFATNLPEANAKFLLQWPDLCDIIIKVAKSKNKKHLKNFLALHSDIKNQDHKENLGLFLLPHLAGSVQCCSANQSKKKKAWKASTEQALDSFLLHVEDYSGDKEEKEKKINTKLNQLKVLYSSYDLLVSALIIVCGPLNEVQKTIVVLGDEWYEFDGSGSPKYAVDTFFKCLNVLKKEFPRASKNVWGYIQKYIYKLALRGENSAIDTLNTKITNHKNLMIQKEKNKSQQKKSQNQSNKSPRKRSSAGTQGGSRRKRNKKV